MNKTILQPFQLHVPDETLADLRTRLARVRWPDEPPGKPWAYGTSVRYMQELVDYWREGFDWRTQEAKLNTIRQFKVSLAGIHVHFIQEEGKGHNPFPLLLTHGWPGSVFEFHKIGAAPGVGPSIIFIFIGNSFKNMRFLVLEPCFPCQNWCDKIFP